MSHLLHKSPGPFLAEQIRAGDYYELSNGHPIECSPAGRDHTGPNVSGAEVLDTDPDVEWSGVDAGFSPEPGTLRAPDVAVGMPAGEGPGWIPGSPPLAVEYAGTGQDEAKLEEMIQDLLAAGTRFVWVVRLVGPRRVEVYEPGEPLRIVQAGDELRAPGVLRNPVPVEALYDRDAAHEVALRNLLQRRGYKDLGAVKEEAREEGRQEGRQEGREEGRAHGTAEGIVTLLESRAVAVDDRTRAQIYSCQDLEILRRWLIRAATVDTAEEILGEEEAGR